MSCSLADTGPGADGTRHVPSRSCEDRHKTCCVQQQFASTNTVNTVASNAGLDGCGVCEQRTIRSIVTERELTTTRASGPKPNCLNRRNSSSSSDGSSRVELLVGLTENHQAVDEVDSQHSRVARVELEHGAPATQPTQPTQAQGTQHPDDGHGHGPDSRRRKWTRKKTVTSSPATTAPPRPVAAYTPRLTRPPRAQSYDPLRQLSNSPLDRAWFSLSNTALLSSRQKSLSKSPSLISSERSFLTMPSFNPFGSVSSKHAATLFEIRLDDEVVVLRGNEHEAASQLLSGTVVLCLASPLKVEDVHLRLTGHLKVGWVENKLTATGITTDRTSRSTEIFNHRWQPFVGGPANAHRGVTLPAGNHEWPFEIIIPGSMAESVEGLSECHIIYKLKATVARGKLAYDLHAYKPVRIIRTLDPAALELSHAMTVENIWPNKVEYSMVIPQKAILFGSFIEVKMRFTSLLKGLRIGTVRCALTEHQEFTVPSAASTTGEKSHKNVREVSVWTFDVSEDDYHDIVDESTGQDGYLMEQKLPLPKRLKECMQDVDTHGIKIRHKVKFNIALHNPDGHVSELRATLPVTIFISPSHQMDEQGCLLNPSYTSQPNVNNAHANAPPLYGQHLMDQLYEDIDHSGFMTPAPASGFSTPFYNQSRAGSTENLAALVGPNAITPAALQSRLQNLSANPRHSYFGRRNNGSGSNTPYMQDDGHGSLGNSYSSSGNLAGLVRNESGYFDQNHHGHSPGTRSAVMSRRASEDHHDHSAHTSGYHTPELMDGSDLADLNKVPSYTTAVKTPIPRNMSYSSMLPNYEAVMSAPPSPQREHAQLASPGELNTVTEGQVDNTRRSSPSSGTASPNGHRDHAHVSMGEGDSRRRLHILQARGIVH